MQEEKSLDVKHSHLSVLGEIHWDWEPVKISENMELPENCWASNWRILAL